MKTEKMLEIWKKMHPRADASKGICPTCHKNARGKMVHGIIGTHCVGRQGRRLHLYDTDWKGYCGNACRGNLGMASGVGCIIDGILE